MLNNQKKPASQVYIKCYVQMNDLSEQFYRDGYTDLNGRFEYLASNKSDIANI